MTATHDRRHTGTVLDRCLGGQPERRKLTPDAAVTFRCELEERLGRGCCEEAAETAVGMVFVEIIAGELDQVPNAEDLRSWLQFAFSEAHRLNRELRRAQALGEWNERRVVSRRNTRCRTAEQIEQLHAALHDLDPFGRSLVEDHYFGRLTLDQLGQKHGLTRSQVRTRLGHALDELRRRMGG